MSGAGVARLDAGWSSWLVEPKWQPVVVTLAESGLCTRPGVDPDVWHPERASAKPGGPVARREAAYAREVCGGCPVIDRCATYALEAGEEFGIWGGLAEWEREQITQRPTPARPVWVVDVLPGLDAPSCGASAGAGVSGGAAA